MRGAVSVFIVAAPRTRMEDFASQAGRHRSISEHSSQTEGVGKTTPHSGSSANISVPLPASFALSTAAPSTAKRPPGEHGLSEVSGQLVRLFLQAAATSVIAVCVLFLTGNAQAAAPVSPADGTTVTNPATFQVSHTISEKLLQAIVRSAASGQVVASCQFPGEKYTGSGTATESCTLAAPLSAGTYGWSYTLSSGGSDHTRTVGSFTVAGAPAPTTTTTTKPATTTTATPTSVASPESLLAGRSVRHANVRVGPIKASVCVGKKGRYVCVARAGNATRLFLVTMTTSPKLVVKWGEWVS